MIPSVGSGQYAPGPSRAEPSLLKDFLPRSYGKCPKKSWPVPGSDARDSILFHSLLSGTVGFGKTQADLFEASLVLITPPLTDAAKASGLTTDRLRDMVK